MSTRSRPRSQQRGDEFEQAIYDLLQRLLRDLGFQITHRRRQKAGTQFGRDLHFKWVDDTGIESSWFFECKNYSSPPDTNEVFGKIEQALNSGYRIDCWALISPHEDVTNEVDELLEKKRKECPFDVVLWTPSTEVRELISLYPKLYKQVYGKAARLTRSRRQKILDKWRQRISQSPRRKISVQSYRQRLIADNERLDFRGLLQVREFLRMRLEDLYVPLKGTTESGQKPLSGDESSLPLPGVDKALLHEHVQAELPTERHVELVQAVRNHHRLVILGDPGSGKSTLLKFIALTFTRGRGMVRERFQLDDDRVPLLIPIAAYGEAVPKGHHDSGSGARDLSFAEFLFQWLDAKGLDKTMVETALKRGECVVMLDGLDEVLELSTRIYVSRQIERFITECDSRNRVIVTSRIAGYQRVAFTGDFTHLTLLPFGDSEIKAFVHCWSEAYEKSLNGQSWKRRAGERERELAEAILSKPPIQRLATNPLLVTALALIHHQGRRLPHERGELYRLCVEALAEHWQRARSLYRPIDLYLGTHRLDERYVVAVLAPIAFWLLETRATGFLRRSELEERIAGWLMTHEGVKEADALSLAHQFVELVREQSGLLTERGADLFDFFHPTFKEYLTARHLCGKREPLESLKNYIFAPRWREVVLLTAGILEEERLNDFLSGILNSGTTFDDLLHRPLFLVARCLADNVPASLQLRRDIAERLLLLWRHPQFSPLRSLLNSIFREAKGSSLARDLADRLLALAQDATVDVSVRSAAASSLGQFGTCQ